MKDVVTILIDHQSYPSLSEQIEPAIFYTIQRGTHPALDPSESLSQIPSTVNIKGCSKSFYVDEVAIYGSQRQFSKWFKIGKICTEHLLRGESTVMVLQETRANRRMFLGHKAASATHSVLSTISSSSTDDSQTNTSLDWTGFLPCVLQNLCCQDAFESGFGFAEFSDVTGTLSQCIATVSVLFIDVNDTVVACLSPSSKETRQYKIKRVHLERASHGMNLTADVPRIPLNDSSFTVPHLLDYLSRISQTSHSLLNSPTDVLSHGCWSTVVIVECQTLWYNSMNGKTDIRKASGILVSLPPLCLDDSQEARISANSTQFEPPPPRCPLPLLLLRDTLNFLETRTAQSEAIKEDHIHKGRITMLSTFRPSSLLLCLLDSYLLLEGSHSVFIGEAPDQQDVRFDATDFPLDFFITTLQMLSSARHLRLTPALLVEFATNEANARTETVDRIACLERENSKLREGLASALALNDIGIRIESLKYKPEGRVVQSESPLSDPSTFQDYQITHLKELCSCLRYQLHYVELLEETGTTLAVDDNTSAVVGYEFLERDADGNEKHDEEVQTHSKNANLKNANLKAAVSFLSNQRKLMQLLTNRLKKTTGEDIDDVTEHNDEQMTIKEIMSIRQELEDMRIQASNVAAVNSEGSRLAVSDDLVELEQAKLNLALARASSVELEHEIFSLKEALIAAKLVNENLQSHLREQNVQLKTLQSNLKKASIDLASANKALDDQQNDFQKSIRRRASLLPNVASVDLLSTVDRYKTPWSIDRSQINEGDDEIDRSQFETHEAVNSSRGSSLKPSLTVVDAFHTLDSPPQAYRTPKRGNSPGINTHSSLSARGHRPDELRSGYVGSVGFVLETVESEMTELELELLSVKRELRLAQKELRREAARQESDIRTIESLENDVQRLTGRLSNAEFEKSELLLEVQGLKIEVEGCRLENLDLRSELNAKEEELKILRESNQVITTQRAEIEKLQTTADGFQLALQYRISPEAVELLKQDAANEKALSKQLSDQIAWTREALKWNEKQLDEAQATIREQSGQIVKYQENEKKQKKELVQAMNTTAILTSAQNEAKTFQSKWAIEKTELQESMKLLIDENQQLVNEAKQNQELINTLGKKLKDIEFDLREIWRKQGGDNAELESNHMIEMVHQFIRNQTDLLQSLRIQVQSASSKLSQAENEKKAAEQTRTLLVESWDQERSEFISKLQQIEKSHNSSLELAAEEARQIEQMFVAKVETLEKCLVDAKRQLNENGLIQAEKEREKEEEIDELKRKLDASNNSFIHLEIDYDKVLMEKQESIRELVVLGELHNIETKKHKTEIELLIDKVVKLLNCLWNQFPIFRPIEYKHSRLSIPLISDEIYYLLQLQLDHMETLPANCVTTLEEVKEIQKLKQELIDIEDKYHQLLTHNNPKQKIHHHLMLKRENANMKKLISDLQRENAILISQPRLNRNYFESNSNKIWPQPKKAASAIESTTSEVPNYVTLQEDQINDSPIPGCDFVMNCCQKNKTAGDVIVMSSSNINCAELKSPFYQRPQPSEPSTRPPPKCSNRFASPTCSLSIRASRHPSPANKHNDANNPSCFL